MSEKKILIIEDEAAIREIIKISLKSAGAFKIYEAANGEKGLSLAQEKQPDLIILDLMLPGIDGLSICRKLKSLPTTQNIPIVMLTAKSEESDIITGLELGACDYITKPFSPKILAARIRAQLRVSEERDDSIEITRGDITINTEQHIVKLKKQELELTFTEFAILELFTKHPGRVYSRDQIINIIKGNDYPVTERSIDVQIVNLRKKLKEWGNNIETIRGIGYRLKTDF